ncbi:MAG: LLM class flavin-dependent oxidoreductase, partial [SAR202 cluster bacterium]|nr:LLM class flavin-dependent oxidoreductase [SAR202 cluster bacterium]
MELGLFLMPLHRPDSFHADAYDQDLKLMEVADNLGYAESWIGEHFTMPWENMPSPELFVARALGVTSQMKFGIGVSLLHMHHPAHVALRIAQLDHLARGRLYFGIGSGSGTEWNKEIFGVETAREDIHSQMMEAISVIQQFWAGKPFHHKGTFYDTGIPEPKGDTLFDYHMIPYQKPHPPIAVAGSSPSSGT